MRMAAAVALLVLVLELLLALAFVVGCHWVGGWHGGLLVTGAVLLLIVLPWLGDLRIWFDSAGPAATVKLAWWGRLTFRTSPRATELRVRVLFIPWTRRTAKDDSPDAAPGAQAAPEEQAEGEPAAHNRRRTGLVRRLNADTVEAIARLALSGLQAANDLIWSAAEIKVRVDDVVEHETADRTLARVFGLRGVGPIDIMMATDEGKRRVRLRYRIGLLRAALAALQVFVEGRPMAVARSMKRRDDGEAPTAADGDQQVIDRIIQQREDEQDAGV